MHNQTYTCRVTTKSNMTVEETITLTVSGELTCCYACVRHDPT